MSDVTNPIEYHWHLLRANDGDGRYAELRATRGGVDPNAIATIWHGGHWCAWDGDVSPVVVKHGQSNTLRMAERACEEWLASRLRMKQDGTSNPVDIINKGFCPKCSPTTLVLVGLRSDGIVACLQCKSPAEPPPKPVAYTWFEPHLSNAAKSAWDRLTSVGVVRMGNTWDSLPEHVRETWRNRIRKLSAFAVDDPCP